MVSFYGNVGGEGGGSGGTTNYNDLINKPFINSVGTTSSPIVIQSLESGRYLISGYFKHGTSQTENVEVPAGTKAEVIVGVDTVTGYKVAEYNTFQNGEIIINKILYDQNGALDKIEKINVGAPGGGDAALQEDVTSNLAVGAIANGTTLEEGLSFTEFVKKLLITEIAPDITFTASNSGIKEVGTTVTPTYTVNITKIGTGTPVSIDFYRGSTKVDSQNYVAGINSYTFTDTDITTSTTVKGVLNYKKSSGTNAAIEKSASYTFVMASYYGAVVAAPIDKAGIVALTKNVKNTKALTATFNLSNQKSCYAYPASFGDLTSIKDANNFEYLGSYTKTTVVVDEVSYNVYTLTDPVTSVGFKQVYA